MSVLLDPQSKKGFAQFMESKTDDMLPRTATHEIDLLTADPKHDEIHIMGSYLSRLQKYPGDIDLFELFVRCCSESTLITEFMKEFKKVVRRIKTSRIHYYSEVKAGFDHRYDIGRIEHQGTDIGEMENGIYIPHKQLSKKISSFYKQKLISKEDYDIIMYILRKKGILNSNDYDIVKNIIRKYHILRWSMEEVLDGKKFINGETILLKDALKDNTLVKVDEITFIQGNIMEVTNIWILGYIKNKNDTNDKVIYINPFSDATIYLPRDIEKLYWSDMWYNPFKMVKRIFSLLRLGSYVNEPESQSILRKLFPFLSSNTSMLYQIKSELDTMELVLEKYTSLPYASIRNQLNIIIDKLSTNIDLTADQASYLIEVIKDIIKSRDRFRIVEYIDEASTFLKKITSKQTIDYLNKVGLNPPPAHVLPLKHMYDRTKVRTPESNPVNPMKILIKQMGGIGGGCSECGRYSKYGGCDTCGGVLLGGYTNLVQTTYGQRIG